MSRFPAVLNRARTGSALASVLALVPLAACHQRSSDPGGPSNPEEVNVGYGQQSREQTGGAVQSATAEQVKDRKVQRVEELLMGRFPGVHVHPTPSGGFSIRIRGTASPGDREPLYVVDGMPIQVTPGRGLEWLDPADIARIDVLRNPAETSMYGGRGADGVIIITTKRSDHRSARPDR